MAKLKKDSTVGGKVIATIDDLDDKVKTIVPLGAKFTDTTYVAGENITISEDNIISAKGSVDVETVKAIKVDNAVNADRLNGRVATDYVTRDEAVKQELLPATPTVLGGIKVGANLSITPDGLLSATSGSERTGFVVRQEVFTATENQTEFILQDGSYSPNANMLSVYIYGNKQPSVSITENSPSSFIVAEGLEMGAVVIAEYFEVSNATPFPHHGKEHLAGGFDPIPKATTLSDGLMSKEDVKKIEKIKPDIQAGMEAALSQSRYYTDSRVQTAVPANAKFTDTISYHVGEIDTDNKDQLWIDTSR